VFGACNMGGGPIVERLACASRKAMHVVFQWSMHAVLNQLAGVEYGARAAPAPTEWGVLSSGGGGRGISCKSTLQEESLGWMWD
jgi:hypothetical protein